MSEELKPCPFCGGEAHLVDDYSSEHDHTFYQVWHDCTTSPGAIRHAYGHALSLQISTPWCANEKDAVLLWNRRAERTCRPEVCDDGAGAWGVYCSECGYRFAGPYGKREVPEHMAGRRDIMPRYCAHCGARVEVVDE